MKKIKKLFILLMVVVLISGCTIKAEYNLTVNSDKTVDLGLIMAFDEEMINMMASENEDEEAPLDDSTYTDDSVTDDYSITDEDVITDDSVTTDDGITTDDSANIDEGNLFDSSSTVSLTDDEQWAYLEEEFKKENIEEAGFAVEKYEKDNLKGYKFTKKFDNIDEITYGDISEALENSELEEDSVEMTGEDISTIDNDAPLFTKDGNNHKFNLPVTNNENMGTLSSVFDMTLTLTLPNEPISHNATSTSEDGKTLTWNILSMTDDIEATFTINNNLVMYIAIGAGILLLLVIIIILIIKGKGKKKKEVTNNVASTPVPEMTNTPAPETTSAPTNFAEINNQSVVNTESLVTPNIPENIPAEDIEQPSIKQPNSMLGTMPINTDNVHSIFSAPKENTISNDLNTQESKPETPSTSNETTSDEIEKL